MVCSKCKSLVMLNQTRVIMVTVGGQFLCQHAGGLSRSCVFAVTVVHYGVLELEAINYRPMQ